MRKGLRVMAWIITAIIAAVAGLLFFLSRTRKRNAAHYDRDQYTRGGRFG